MSEKPFNLGMYGGKFMPMHIGHYHCLETAAKECNKVFCILFYGGIQEQEIHKSMKDRYLSLDSRIRQLYRVAGNFDNVVPVVLDISSTVNDDGTEDWDAQTPMVVEAMGRVPDAVYGSEPSYAAYFERAYPGVTYRILDPERKEIHISATDLRSMPWEKRKNWMV